MTCKICGVNPIVKKNIKGGNKTSGICGSPECKRSAQTHLNRSVSHYTADFTKRDLVNLFDDAFNGKEKTIKWLLTNNMTYLFKDGKEWRATPDQIKQFRKESEAQRDSFIFQKSFSLADL